MQLFFGIIILGAPFLLLLFLKDLKKGFLQILTYWSGAILLISTILQFFGIFDYFWVSLSLIVFIGIFFYLFFKFKKEDKKLIKKIDFKRFLKNNLFFVFGILLISFQLYLVHYSYTGQVNAFRGQQAVVDKNIAFPYYSDEWVGVAMVKKAINTKAIVLDNPLMNGGYAEFPNIFIFFFILISLPLLLVGIPVIYSYTILGIVVGLLTCSVFYIFLRSLGFKKYFSFLGMALIPFITVAGNVPGLWNLIPFSLGLMFFFISLSAISFKDNFLFYTSVILSLITYPPLIILIFPSVVIYLFLSTNKEEFWSKIWWFLLAVVFLIVAIIFIQFDDKEKLFELFKSSLWRFNPENGWQPRHPWKMLPSFIWYLSFLGIIPVFKKDFFKENIRKIVFINIFILAFLWIFSYFYYKHFIVLDIAKISVIASYFIILLAVLALSFLYKYLKDNFSNFFSQQFFSVFVLFTFLFLLLASFSYTKRDNWRYLYLIKELDNQEKLVLYPDPPITAFLTEDDLKLFSSFSKKRFISDPWKGLVVGAASGNYPVDSKVSIVSNNLISYEFFKGLNCANKKQVFLDLNIRYAYTEDLNCPGFIWQGRSSEGLNLYKFDPSL